MPKIFSFGSSSLPLSEILVALLVVFIAADRFFKRLFGPHAKRAKKRCRPYPSLFSDLNTKFSKKHILEPQNISFYSEKFSLF